MIPRIQCRLMDPHAACHIDIGITIAHTNTHPFLNDCHQQIHTIIIRTGRSPSRHIKVRLTYKCLHLDQDRSGSLDRAYHDRTRRLFWLSRQHILGTVWHFYQSVATHFKNTDLIRRTETVFDTTQETVRSTSISFKIQNSIDHML